MKVEPMDLQDFGILRQSANRSEEYDIIEGMTPNTALVIKNSMLKCQVTNNGTPSCTIARICGYLRQRHPTRHWHMKHVPEGHAIACYPVDTPPPVS